MKYKENFEKGIFVLNGKITSETAYGLISKILLYKDKSSHELTLFINSLGGSLADGFAIYDVLRAIPNRVKIVCKKRVGGVALLIASSGDEDNRYYCFGTRFLIGNFEVSREEMISAYWDDSENFEKNMSDVDNVTQKYYECLSKNLNMDINELVLLENNKKIPRKMLKKMGFKCR